MTMQIRRNRSTTFLSLIIMMFFTTACGGAGEPPPDGGEDPIEIVAEPTEGLPETLGVVLDPDGLPVPFAIVGDSEIATKEGVFSGALDSYDSGWTTVKALGYATAFSRSFAEYRGVDLYEARLTPFQSMASLNPDEPSQLAVGGDSGLIIELEIDASAISESPALVGVTPLDLLDVGPVHEPHPSNADLKPQYAFAVEIYNETLEGIELISGATYSINFDDAGELSPEAKLATFNPETGAWVELHDVCSRETTTTLNCTLDQLSPLMAWFDVETSMTSIQTEDSINAPSTLMATTQTVMNYIVNFTGKIAPPKIDLDEDYQKAKDALDAWINEQSGGINQDDPRLIELLEALIKAARDFAKNNQNEAGKFHLLLAGQSAMYGTLDLWKAPMKEATDLANKLGEKALKEIDCGEFRDLFKAAGQIQTIGGDMNLADQLTKKAKEMAEDCDVWEGWIRVILPPSSSHPAGLPMSSMGGGWWTESHFISMWTNVKTYVMHGTDEIQLSFPQVTYSKEDECTQEITISGSPSFSTQYAAIEGQYDGNTFQIGKFDALTEGISIAQTWDFQKKDDEICVQIMSRQFSFPNHVSVIGHGFSTGSPSITLQKMLTEGIRRPTPAGDSIGGSEYIVNPDTDLGIYPVITGTVTWRFIHVENKLPLKEQ